MILNQFSHELTAYELQPAKISLDASLILSHITSVLLDDGSRKERHMHLYFIGLISSENLSI